MVSEFIATKYLTLDHALLIIKYHPVVMFVTYRLSGYSPFAGDDNQQTFQFVNQADYDFDDEAWERVSDDAKDFIKRLLIKDKKYVIHFYSLHSFLHFPQ